MSRVGLNPLLKFRSNKDMDKGSSNGRMDEIRRVIIKGWMHALIAFSFRDMFVLIYSTTNTTNVIN